MTANTSLMALHFIVVSLFIGWFFLTVMNQFDCSWTRRLREHDPFHLIPRWTFFAPHPGTSDYHLVYREIDSAGALTPFKELPVLDRSGLLAAVWNPRKRVQKTFLDLAMDLSRICASGSIDESKLRVTFSYLGLLNFLTAAPKRCSTRGIQFALLRSNGFIDQQEPILIICSDFHDV